MRMEVENKKVKFHIIHNYTSLNKGWAAIVLSATKIIKETIPNAEFTIESYHPNVDRKMYGAYDIKVVEKIVSSKLKGATLLVKALFWRILYELGLNTSKLGLIAPSAYHSSEIILDLAGDCLSIPSGDCDIRFKLQRNILAIAGDAYLLLLFLLLKKPVVIYAQTIGPIGMLRPLIKPLVDRMNLITVREENSLHYLEKIGVNYPRVYLTADPAFLLPTPPSEEIDEILRREGINVKSPIIGMCISSETAKYHFRDGEQKFAELFARIIDSLIDKYGAKVILIPFSTWEGHGGDDRIISKKIISLTKEKEKVKLITDDYSPITLKGIISQCNIFVGSRGHSCIIALSSCIPTIAIGHNPKYHGMMKMVNQEHYVCKVQEITYDKLISLIHNLWNNQEKEKEELKSKIKLTRRLAILNAELVRNLLREKGIIYT